MNNFSIYKELQKESLFNEWTDELIGINGNVNFGVEIWDTAKDYAYNIATSVDPVGMFKICQSEIQNKYFMLSLSYTNIYETCLACVFTMIFKSADRAVNNKIIDYISKNYFFPTDLENKILSVLDKIDKGELNDDYDYSKKKTRNKAAAKKVNTTDNGKTQALEKRIQELEKNKEELEEELAEYKEGPIVDKPHNKVVLELFAKLLEESGADLNKRGNKANAARLAETITGLPFSICKAYMTYRDLKTTPHSEEVLKMNTAIKELGIEWQL